MHPILSHLVDTYKSMNLEEFAFTKGYSHLILTISIHHILARLSALLFFVDLAVLVVTLHPKSSSFLPGISKVSILACLVAHFIDAKIFHYRVPSELVDPCPAITEFLRSTTTWLVRIYSLYLTGFFHQKHKFRMWLLGQGGRSDGRWLPRAGTLTVVSNWRLWEGGLLWALYFGGAALIFMALAEILLMTVVIVDAVIIVIYHAVTQLVWLGGVLSGA
jgi:hypothetical protein